MKIVSARYNQFGSIEVTVEDQPSDVGITVPDDMENKDRQALADWAAKEGNEIKAYEAPPEAKPARPTLEEIKAQLEDLAAQLATRTS